MDNGTAADAIAPCICAFCLNDYEHVTNMLYSHAGNCFICEACVYQCLRELASMKPSYDGAKELHRLKEERGVMDARIDALEQKLRDAAG